MPSERFGLVKFRVMDVTVVSPDLKPGDSGPEFSVQTLDWSPFKGFADTQGKVPIIAAVPSLDADVCDRETRRFNLEASGLSQDIVTLIICADLPSAQNRWCGAAGVDQLTVLSDPLLVDFGLMYGCLIKNAHILRRAAFVVDRQRKLTYTAYRHALGEEPDYTEVLAAAQAALS